MVDNCYGELVETKEPGHVGADIVVGSLMKNLGVSFKGGMVSIGKTTMSLKQFGIWALIITAAIVALTLAINYFSNNTAKGKARRALESAEDAAKSTSEAADEAKKSFE